MALTAAQKSTLYRIYRIPPGGTVSFYGQLNVNTGNLINSIDVSAIVTEIDTRAAALNSDQETDLIGLLTEYDTITVGSTASMQGGSIGSLTSVSESDPKRRDQILAEVEHIIGINLQGLYDQISAMQGGGRIKAVR